MTIGQPCIPKVQLSYFHVPSAISYLRAVTVRPSTVHDLAEWIRMRRALWPDCSPARQWQEIQQFASSQSPGVVIVAERDNGGLCGFAEVSVRHEHVDGTSSVPVAYLEAWYVEPEFRGQDIGRQLIEAVEAWALARGLKELASDAELENKSSIDAQVSCGFIETCRTVHFVKPIGPTAGNQKAM
jgi:aminoglycoside 6'-N-acetyltransferase I